MDLNGLLGSPKGTMNLQGTSRATAYYFRLVTEDPNGRQSRVLPIDLVGDITNKDANPPAAIVKRWEEMIKTDKEAPVMEVKPGPK